jgi:hypothetical protein
LTAGVGGSDDDSDDDDRKVKNEAEASDGKLLTMVWRPRKDASRKGWDGSIMAAGPEAGTELADLSLRYQACNLSGCWNSQ